jgi:NAD(P)-dependent dehydrogenase (short-subunit alcohol dehydrogenase family)
MTYIRHTLDMAAAPTSTPEYHLNRLSGKVAIVTGGANEGGFGAAISKRFLAEGARVLIGDLDENGLKAMSEKLNTPNVRCIRMDVTKEESWRNAIDLVIKDFGHLDIIVNNAGTTYPNKPTAEVTVKKLTIRSFSNDYF